MFMTKQESRRAFQTVTSFESRKIFYIDGTVFQSLISDKKNRGCRPKEIVIQPGTNWPKHLKTDTASP